MKSKIKLVSGVYAPTARVTLRAVFLVAVGLSVPVFVGLTVASWIW
ncbi:MAG: hypothetical protein Q9M48_04870 [Rhodobacterales bacterium]|nr:hypothetical protein [Rhodobacterales bacterium]